MQNYDFLSKFSKDELIKLIENYAKNWLAMDGVWFQSVERKNGMDAAMFHDLEVWRSFTVIEAKRIKEFLHLGEQPGLVGLAQALQLRFYANINEAQTELCEDKLIYTMTQCRVQTARARKGLPFHPCKAVGVIEYGDFAKTIDSRIQCRCLSCYPDVDDDSCCCKWEFTLH